MSNLESIQRDLEEIISQIEDAKLQASKLSGKQEGLLVTLEKEFGIKSLKAAKKEIVLLKGKRSKLMPQLERQLKKLNGMIEGVEHAE